MFRVVKAASVPGPSTSTEGIAMRINFSAVTGRRAFARAGVALLIGTGVAVGGAAPASAQILVPAGCGALSGLPVPVGFTLEDHSGDPGPLGTAGSPFSTQVTNNMITVGTPFADFIEGSNTPQEVICGRNGADVINGNGGNDEIYGGNGRDVLSGGEFRDEIHGEENNDTIHGDEVVATGFDQNDELRGGLGNDTITGGNDVLSPGVPDTITGGGGSNTVTP
jgi:Ca2+-binding RTX toxin-like protein